MEPSSGVTNLVSLVPLTPARTGILNAAVFPKLNRKARSARLC